MHFDQMPVVEPRLDEIEKEYAAIHAAFDEATDAAGRRAAIESWDQLRKRLDTWSSLVHVHFCQDTRDAERKKRREYADSMRPKLQDLNVRLLKKLVASEHRAELEEAFGKHAFDLWDNEISTFDPVIEEDLVRESNLDAEYTELLSSAPRPSTCPGCRSTSSRATGRRGTTPTRRTGTGSRRTARSSTASTTISSSCATAWRASWATPISWSWATGG